VGAVAGSGGGGVDGRRGLGQGPRSARKSSAAGGPPVFTDLSGRRLRRMRQFGVGAAAALLAWLIAMAVGLPGGPKGSVTPRGGGGAFSGAGTGTAGKVGPSPAGPAPARSPTPGSPPSAPGAARRPGPAGDHPGQQGAAGPQPHPRAQTHPWNLTRCLLADRAWRPDKYRAWLRRARAMPALVARWSRRALPVTLGAD